MDLNPPNESRRIFHFAHPVAWRCGSSAWCAELSENEVRHESMGEISAARLYISSDSEIPGAPVEIGVIRVIRTPNAR